MLKNKKINVQPVNSVAKLLTVFGKSVMHYNVYGTKTTPRLLFTEQSHHGGA